MKLYYFFISFSLLRCIAAENLSRDKHARSSWEMIDDMILSPEQMRILYSPSYEGRNVDSDLAYRWENATVPYECSSDFSNDEQELIKNILQEEYAKTCIKFRPREETDKNYLRIVDGKGCSSYVGRLGNMQLLFLKKEGCLFRRSIAHEFLHALGVYHQHSAHDRDDYLTIQWENIKPGMEKNFQKQETNRVTNFGLPYDYDSIMHYRKNVFSKNGKPTIVSKKPNTEFGYATSLSPTDILKVNKMYNCNPE